MKTKSGVEGVGEESEKVIFYSFALVPAFSELTLAEAPATQQHAKKVMFNSPGLVDFVVRLVIFVLNLPDGQVLFWGKFKLIEGL